MFIPVVCIIISSYYGYYREKLCIILNYYVEIAFMSVLTLFFYFFSDYRRIHYNMKMTDILIFKKTLFVLKIYDMGSIHFHTSKMSVATPNIQIV